jgi:hypothetical protein
MLHGPLNVNPLNAELNLICQFLALLEDLTFIVCCVLWVAYATHSTLKPVPTLPR